MRKTISRWEIIKSVSENWDRQYTLLLRLFFSTKCGTINLALYFWQGWIQHDLVGGGGALAALVPSCVSHVCRRPSTCFTTAKSCLTTVFEL